MGCCCFNFIIIPAFVLLLCTFLLGVFVQEKRNNYGDDESLSSTASSSQYGGNSSGTLIRPTLKRLQELVFDVFTSKFISAKQNDSTSNAAGNDQDNKEQMKGTSVLVIHGRAGKSNTKGNAGDVTATNADGSPRAPTALIADADNNHPEARIQTFTTDGTFVIQATAATTSLYN